jgi:hypothetical protein
VQDQRHPRNHLGERNNKERFEDYEPDRLGGFEIDEQLQSYRQFYRQIAGFCSLENFVHKRCRTSKILGYINSIAK